ncbi:MAG: lysophospholipid acyltransferase family protein [bacterium]|nr:lysophospholipid acyltransferase family protein [bacterium]
MKKAKASRKIEAKKRGNALGFWFFRISLRFFGLRGAYGLLYIVCIYYVLFDQAAVCGALAYINRRFPSHGFVKRLRHVYRLFVSQGKQLIDRYAIVSGQEIFDIQLHGYEQLMSLIQNSPHGIILLTAHVGNWQVAMTALKKLEKTVYLVMRPEDNPAVQSSLRISREQNHIKIISPEQDLGGIVEIMNKLKEKHIVSIMGDRRYGFKAVEVSFLGEKAWFPYGGFTIAAAAGCPVVVLLSEKVSTYQYIVDVSNVLYPCYISEKDKHHQLQQWVQKFAALLEAYTHKHPYQYFLFRDVWEE